MLAVRPSLALADRPRNGTEAMLALWQDFAATRLKRGSRMGFGVGLLIGWVVVGVVMLGILIYGLQGTRMK